MEIFLRAAYIIAIALLPSIALPNTNENATQLTFHFEANSSSPRITKPVPVTIQSFSNKHNGRVYLSSALGKVTPTYVELANGKWTGDITFFESGKNNYLIMHLDTKDNASSGNNNSYTFDVANENGDLAPDAMLAGKIMSAYKKPIEDVTVQLFNGNPQHGGQQIYSTVTNSDGNYSFKNVFPGVYYQVIQKAGHQQRVGQEIMLAAKRLITKDHILHCACTNPNKLTPVLLVPGIMGSCQTGIFGECHKSIFYPFLPINTPKWNETTLQLFDSVDAVGWETLKDALEDTGKGYVRGCTIIDVPYDWALSIPDIRDQYLKPWIDEAKKNSPNNKVDIIAHSMGGLVTRAYVQSTKYENDVRKFAVVGTPSKGAELAYYLWEGGDPKIADENIPYNWFTGNYFYTNTLNYYYMERSKDKKQQICTFESGLSSWYPIKCDTNTIYDYMHKKAPSVGQLIPTYDNALLQNDKNVPIVKEENTLIKVLNLNSNSSFYTAPQYVFTRDITDDGIQTKLFAGKIPLTAPVKELPIKSIYIEPQQMSKTYQDGTPNISCDPIRGVGDGTVLYDSVFFDEAFPSFGKQRLDFESINSPHSSLIKNFTPKLVEFITETEIKQMPAKQKQKPKILSIHVEGRIQPSVISVIDPNNNPVKLTDLAAKEHFKIGSSSIRIKNPLDGKYSISLNSPYNEDYEISISYYNNDKLFAHRHYGYFDASLKTFSFTVNNESSVNPIVLDRAFNTPTDLKANNESDKIQLVWQDAAGDTNKDVDSYEIYWKSDIEPYMHLLVQTKQKEYLTNHDWKDVTTNIYAVRSILKNGESTFLSPLEFFVSTEPEGTIVPSYKATDSNWIPWAIGGGITSIAAAFTTGGVCLFKRLHQKHIHEY